MALAEAPASFSGFRSFRIVLPLQRWPHFPGHATPLPLAVLLLPFLPLQFLLLLFVLVLLLFLLLIFLLILL